MVFSGRGAGVARTFGVGEAGGSIPLVPTITGGGSISLILPLCNVRTDVLVLFGSAGELLPIALTKQYRDSELTGQPPASDSLTRRPNRLQFIRQTIVSMHRLQVCLCEAKANLPCSDIAAHGK